MSEQTDLMDCMTTAMQTYLFKHPELGNVTAPEFVRESVRQKLGEQRRCGRCGRALSDEVSVQRGFGPICWPKQQAEIAWAEVQITESIAAKRAVA